MPDDQSQAGETSGEDADAHELVYEANSKHSDPFQGGQRGSLCEKEVQHLAQELLEGSVLVGRKRYAVYNGKAYCAHEHRRGRWHGFPIGWNEVPSRLALDWQRHGLVSKRDRHRFKESH